MEKAVTEQNQKQIIRDQKLFQKGTYEEEKKNGLMRTWNFLNTGKKGVQGVKDSPSRFNIFDR